MQPLQQAYAEAPLQRFHLLSHGGGRHMQLLRGQFEAEMPRGGFEGFQGIERRQAWAHGTDFMRKTRAGTRNDALRGRAPQHY